jgi:GNAT superfamily N-acetyltransferase
MVRLPPLSQALRHPQSHGDATPRGRSVTLGDGSEIVISRITPGDAPLLADGFARLSAESRRLRFLTAKPSLTEAELRYLTEVDGHRHEALGAIDPATGAGVAVARFVRDERDPARAEVAITVADEWQHRGVGKLLLALLADRAREEGVSHFTALVSGDNRSMQALLGRQGAPVRFREAHGGAAEYEVELAPQGIGAQLEDLLRAAALGHWQMPPRICDALRALVPINFQRR